MIRRISALLTALLLTTLPLAALADTWYLENSDITVTANESGQIVTQGETSKSDGNPTITQKDSNTIFKLNCLSSI